ncbi:hypothetical protein N7495_004437 [Penicillium taxi]|uniref:uncharacterized protein n=1 Tax=Penicillium taxi TaxID=168475 RepID=UPI00254588A1|nr:uncharacterized protein N7495_004437 [Penicillium taxi]KAJ5899693.1 hypothetical protein N7495_004437 [Penicillium taxi]
MLAVETNDWDVSETSVETSLLMSTTPRHHPNTLLQGLLSPIAESSYSNATIKSPVKKVLNWDYGGFFYDLNYIGFKCAKENCDKQCAQGDSDTRICPACGPCSEVRYCSEDHLIMDIKAHFAKCGEYGQSTFIHPCRMSTIRDEHIRGPPMLPAEFTETDTVERHRQAVWFNCMHHYGDYFIFSDQYHQTVDALQGLHFVPLSELAVLFSGEERDRFRRSLALAFLDGGKALELVEYVYRMIRDYFRKEGKWNSELEGQVHHQLAWELGYTLNPAELGLRHACAKDWFGAEGICRDEICKFERASHGYDESYGGLQKGCIRAESKNWLLRAARFTHPSGLSIQARTMGEGWGNMVPKIDRRQFHRGEGWDGFGSGPIEMVKMD